VSHRVLRIRFRPKTQTNVYYPISTMTASGT
jgi:hypothetical protein